MRKYFKIAAVAVVTLLTMTLTSAISANASSSGTVARSSTVTARAWDLTQHVVNTCQSEQVPPYVTFTGHVVATIKAPTNLHNGWHNSLCREIHYVKYGPADNIVGCWIGEGGCQYGVEVMPGLRWILCWTTGDYVNGWNIWDKVYTHDNPDTGIRVIGWIWDGAVVENITSAAPHC